MNWRSAGRIFHAMTGLAEYLHGKLLVAMPGMGDPRFERSVIFMCAHSAEGAMGLMINKPAPDLRFSDLLGQLEIEGAVSAPEMEVYFGGPVEHGRGFVLHTSDYTLPDATMEVEGAYGMTATVDVLRDIAAGRGPRRALLALGYSGWGPGQLEGEIQANGWLTTEAREDLIFGARAHSKWEGALSQIGIDPRLLSAEGGRA